MCRLTVYKGTPLLIGDIVTHPENSLLYQSRDAAYHPGVVDENHQRNILVNGDGFGVAWYGRHLQKGSCCFKFVTPAWSNANLKNIGEHVESHLIFAHIRAATAHSDSSHERIETMRVNNENCHPFKYGRYTFMHNGGIPNFSKIKLKLLNKLSEWTFGEIKGSTDSEHMFALFLDLLGYNSGKELGVSDMIRALNELITTIVELCNNAGIDEPCSLNLCVTDGVNIVATRFRNGPQSPPSLYYNYGSNFVCENGKFYAASNNAEEGPNSIVISSAPLSRVEAYCANIANINSTAGITSAPSASNVPSLSASTSPQSGRRHSNSTASFLASVAHSKQNEVIPPELEINLQQHQGAWILIPKDCMLVCIGNPDKIDVVESIHIEPIMIPEEIANHHMLLQQRKHASSNAHNVSPTVHQSQSKLHLQTYSSDPYQTYESQFIHDALLQSRGMLRSPSPAPNRMEQDLRITIPVRPSATMLASYVGTEYVSVGPPQNSMVLGEPVPTCPYTGYPQAEYPATGSDCYSACTTKSSDAAESVFYCEMPYASNTGCSLGIAARMTGGGEGSNSNVEHLEDHEEVVQALAGYDCSSTYATHDTSPTHSRTSSATSCSQNSYTLVSPIAAATTPCSSNNNSSTKNMPKNTTHCSYFSGVPCVIKSLIYKPIVHGQRHAHKDK